MRLTIAALLVLAFVANPLPASWADGMMIPDLATWEKMHEDGRWNEPEQKAIIYFDRGVEQLFISPKYEGPANKFAWVIPVPSKPKVEIASEALFLEVLEASSTVMAAPTPKVDVIERKAVGDYDVSVLSSNDSGALMKWLSENGYHLPDAATSPLQYYITQNWTFVACRVSAPESGAGKKLRTGILAPLKLTFLARKPIYPLRLSSANPEPFELGIFLVLPRPADRACCLKLGFEGPITVRWAERVIYYSEGQYFTWQHHLPLLWKLSGGRDIEIYTLAWLREHRIQPAECKSDLAWPATIHRISPDEGQWPGYRPAWIPD